MTGSKAKPHTDPPSEGARLLRDTLKARGLTQEDAEALLGASNGLVSLWLNGKRKEPGLRFSQRLLEVFGIEPRLWLVPPLASPEPVVIDDDPTAVDDRHDTEPAPPLTPEGH